MANEDRLAREKFSPASLKFQDPNWQDSNDTRAVMNYSTGRIRIGAFEQRHSAGRHNPMGNLDVSGRA